MKIYKLWLPLVIAGFVASCSSSKEANVAQVPEVKKEEKSGGIQATYRQMEFDRYYFDGLKEKLNNNYQNALQNFEKAAQIDASNAAVHYEIGRIYSSINNTKSAESAAKKAISLDGENKWYQLLLADVYQQEKKFSEAAAIYDELISKYPEETDHYFQLAAMHLYMGKPFDAVKAYDRYEKQFGISDDVVLHKHRIYLETGKYDRAIEEVNKLIKWSPDNKTYYQLLAETYLQAGQQDKAFAVYDEMLKKHPDDGGIQLSLADYYIRQGDKTKGMDLMIKAFGNEKVDIDKKVQILYSRYLMREGLTTEEVSDAYALAELLTKTHPEDAKSHALYGDILYNNNKFEEARIQYRNSLERRKDIFSVWQQLFFIESALRDFPSMEKESERAMEFFPNQPLVYFFSGVAKLEQHKYKEAEETLQSGLNMIIDNPSLQTQFYINLAETKYRQKEYASSDKYFDKVLELDPDNALALNNYAYYLSERNAMLDKAEEMSKKSLLTEPDNASYLDTYGWILYKRGNYQEAEKYIRQSLEKEPNSAEVMEHLGDVLYKLGHAQQALDQWKKAKEVGKGYSERLDKKIAEKKLYE